MYWKKMIRDTFLIYWTKLLLTSWCLLHPPKHRPLAGEHSTCGLEKSTKSFSLQTVIMIISHHHHYHLSLVLFSCLTPLPWLFCSHLKSVTSDSAGSHITRGWTGLLCVHTHVCCHSLSQFPSSTQWSSLLPLLRFHLFCLSSLSPSG